MKLPLRAVPRAELEEGGMRLIEDAAGDIVARVFEDEVAEALVRRANTHNDLAFQLNLAIQRVEIANREGDPILSAWLPGAHKALEESGNSSFDWVRI